jgi:hypothetical protein
MVWWRTTLTVLSTILLCLSLVATVFTHVLAGATSEETLRPLIAPTGTDTFDTWYQKTYSCGVVGCFNHQPDEGIGAVLFSKAGHAYLSTLALELLLLSLALTVVLMFVPSCWAARLACVAIAFTVAGLFTGLAFAQSTVLAFVPSAAAAYVTPAVASVFDTLTLWFGITLIIGILLLISAWFVKKYERPEVHNEKNTFV